MLEVNVIAEIYLKLCYQENGCYGKMMEVWYNGISMIWQKFQVKSIYYSGDIGKGSRRLPLPPLPGCEMSKKTLGWIGLRQSFPTNTFKITYSTTEHIIV